MPAKNGEYVPCAECGQPVYRTPARPARFCSRSCARSASNRTAANPAKHKPNNRPTLACAHCGRAFRAYPSSQRIYCSQSCATTARNLTETNPAKHRDISGDRNPMYGKRSGIADQERFPTQRRAASPQWKGGRKVRKDGYVLVVAPDDHPYPADQHAASGLKYILEHRHVMEQHLGRYLRPHEVVHHLDGNPSNNELANLQLFGSHAEHIRVGHGGGR